MSEAPKDGTRVEARWDTALAPRLHPSKLVRWAVFGGHAGWWDDSLGEVMEPYRWRPLGGA